MGGGAISLAFPFGREMYEVGRLYYSEDTLRFAPWAIGVVALAEVWTWWRAKRARRNDDLRYENVKCVAVPACSNLKSSICQKRSFSERFGTAKERRLTRTYIASSAFICVHLRFRFWLRRCRAGLCSYAANRKGIGLRPRPRWETPLHCPV
jgi:hypothetical protein